MAKKKVSRVSTIIILVLSLLAVAVAIVPNYVEKLPVIDTYNYLGIYLKNLDLLKPDFIFSEYTWGITATAIGTILSGIVVLVSIIGLIAKRSILRTIITLLAFLGKLGILVFQFVYPLTKGLSIDAGYILKNIATGYYIQLGLTFIAFIVSFFGKREA